MDLVARADGTASWDGRPMRCALGRNGCRPDKREGDGATPIGAWPMRRVLFRADQLGLPVLRFAVHPIARHDGWCDDPADPAYNRVVRLPYPASAERLWRRDRVYDLVVPLGYNDAAPVPGFGSAIFLHVARRGFPPTAGCVALALADLLRVVAAADTASRVIVEPS